MILLKAIDRAVTRFCYRHPNFGIRNLMLYLVAASGIFYVFYMMDTTGSLMSYITFNPAMILRGQVWRIFTFLLMPIGDNIFFEVIALYFYYFIGSSLERQWGTARFTIYYLSGILFNVVYGFVIYLILTPTLGGAVAGSFVGFSMSASYLNLSMFFAFASIWPDAQVLLFFIIPIRMKWLALVDALFFLVSILRNMGVFPMNLLPLVAILNFFLFCWDGLRHNLIRTRGFSKRRGQFRSAIHQSREEERVQGYRHKCSVCGRTDVTNPELEFRYCSKCQGYHCFCQDHINNHVHFTQ